MTLYYTHPLIDISIKRKKFISFSVDVCLNIDQKSYEWGIRRELTCDVYRTPPPLSIAVEGNTRGKQRTICLKPIVFLKVNFKSV